MCVSLMLHLCFPGYLGASVILGMWSLEDKDLFFEAIQQLCGCCYPDLHFISVVTSRWVGCVVDTILCTSVA